MAKKLTLEVDAETSKAERKIQELAHLADSTDGGTAAKNVARDLNSAATAAKKIAEAMDKQSTAAENAGSLSKAQADHLATASNAAKKLAYSTYEGNANLRAMTKVFAGMAIQMATAQAAQSMPEGSAGRTAINAGGAAIAGALQGSVAGPLGALAGATMGLTTALMQASAEEKARRKAIEDSAIANREQLKAMEDADKRSEEFKKKLSELTSIKDLGERRAALDQAIKDSQNRYDTEIYGKLFESSSETIADENSDAEFRRALSERADWKNEMSQLKSARDALNVVAQNNPAFRESMTAVDSLSRLGGNFGGGGDVARDQLKTQQEQLNVLKRLEEKQDKKGSTTWQ